MLIFWPYKMIGSFSDGCESVVSGLDESDCMAQLIELQALHGKLEWNSAYAGRDYNAGRYIYSDNSVCD